MKRISFFAALIIVLLIAAPMVFSQSAGMNFRQDGIASWYGPGFAGRPTASGEIFNPAQYTAAHPSLPFGTILLVTNTINNRQVRVRVNDRGPFVATRIIDVSEAAAASLDMLVTGTAHVIIETTNVNVLGPVSPYEYVAPASPAPSGEFHPPVSTSALPPSSVTPTPTPAPTYTPPAYTPHVTTPPVSAPPENLYPQPQVTPAPEYILPELPVYTPPAQPQMVRTEPAVIIGGMPPMGTGKFYRLQVGAYRVPRNAVEVFETLKAAGLNPGYERAGEDIYRVVLARLTPEELPRVTEILGAAGFREVLLREER